jgi:Retron-type reverse transcriptase
MVYIVTKQPPQYHQMTLEELLFSTDYVRTMLNPNLTNTRTDTVFRPSQQVISRISVRELVAKLIDYNERVDALRSVSRKSLYSEFYIPKSSGGLRKIDAPLPDLMDALRSLKTMLETDFNPFGVMYHTSAFAYIRGRSTIDAVKRHQANESKWYAKFDLSNFFGSTTLEFVMKMMSMIFPFSEVMRSDIGKKELEKALELAFLDGGLPQGTPISPLITNIMMIPVDFQLSKDFRKFRGAGRTAKNESMPQRFIYTRYADDFIISSRYEFAFRAIENHIREVLASFDAPFTVKPEKTRYGSSAGANWNLGVMINADNQITVGYKRKREFKAMLTSYILDKQRGVRWEKNDIQVLDGYRNYYRMVEKDTIDDIIRHLDEKFKSNVVKMIKEDLKAA